MGHLVRLAIVVTLVAFAILATAVGLATNTGALLAPFHLLLLLVLVALYIVPTALALYRNSKATVWIGALNILFGWTLFGWVIALGWAANGKTIEPHPHPLSSTRAH